MEWQEMVKRMKAETDGFETGKELREKAEKILCDKSLGGQTLWSPDVLARYARDLENDAANN